MASRTGRTRLQRKTRKSTKGKERKRIARNKGTTPKFAIHKDKATVEKTVAKTPAKAPAKSPKSTTSSKSA